MEDRLTSPYLYQIGDTSPKKTKKTKKKRFVLDVRFQNFVLQPNAMYLYKNDELRSYFVHKLKSKIKEYGLYKE